MGLIVQKFGGSSVKDAEHIINVADIVTKAYDNGNNIVVVVSAQGDTTDDLLAKAAEINTKASKREMDMLLSTGEQISASLLAMAIEKLGYPVKSLTGWQAGFVTDTTHSNSRIKRIEKERLLNEIDKKNIVIVTGFQGVNMYDDITTLGRGGSDTSAVAIAAVLHADICQIYTDVDGVYTTDPRIVPNARKLDEISFDEMLELSSQGAQILHTRSVEMAKKYSVNLEVLSSITKKPGTKIKEETTVEKLLIKGIAKDENIARLSIIGIDDTPGIAFKIFSQLAARKINVDIILQSVGRDNKRDISFTVDASQKDDAMEVLENMKGILNPISMMADEEVAKVSIVGAGMITNPGIAAGMFEALADMGINIQMISTSEIKISVLIDKKDTKKAVTAIHDKFIV